MEDCTGDIDLVQTILFAIKTITERLYLKAHGVMEPEFATPDKTSENFI